MVSSLLPCPVFAPGYHLRENKKPVPMSAPQGKQIIGTG